MCTKTSKGVKVVYLRFMLFVRVNSFCKKKSGLKLSWLPHFYILPTYWQPFYAFIFVLWLSVRIFLWKSFLNPWILSFSWWLFWILFIHKNLFFLLKIFWIFSDFLFVRNYFFKVFIKTSKHMNSIISNRSLVIKTW